MGKYLEIAKKAAPKGVTPSELGYEKNERNEKTGPGYFRDEYLRLVDFLDDQWPLLPRTRKDQVFALVDRLDDFWLAEDRENFDRVIREIREAAIPVAGLADASKVPEQTRLFQVSRSGGDDPS